MRIFDELPFHGRCVVQFDNASGNRKQLRKLRGAETSCARNDLKTVGVGPDGNGLDEAVLSDALCQFLQLRLLEGEAWVGGGFMNLVDGDELECAAVLHGALLWAWL